MAGLVAGGGGMGNCRLLQRIPRSGRLRADYEDTPDLFTSLLFFACGVSLDSSESALNSEPV